MAWRVDQVRTQILATGCNKPSKGFTLIELLVVMVVIGIATSLVVLNFSAIALSSKQSASFTQTFNHLTEESIITGNIIGWHANNRDDFSYYLDINNKLSNKLDDPHPSQWNELSSYRKTFKSFDGSFLELDKDSLDKPLLIFYPSGENSGGVINIYLLLLLLF
jgi:prepilin-type N-terminal cleavage/methylation domain-containing protein